MKSFNQKVWDLLVKIPQGKVTTYKILADQLGTKAYRAVGHAVGLNPQIPQVPCHRVVGSDGHLRGYAHGLKKKEELLLSEGVKVNNQRIVDFRNKLFTF